MRQEDWRNLVGYRGLSERNCRRPEPSRQSSAKLAASGCRRYKAFGVEHFVGYLHDVNDVTTFAWSTLAVIVWHLDGKPAVLAWSRRRNGGKVIGGRDSRRDSGGRHSGSRDNDS